MNIFRATPLVLLVLAVATAHAASRLPIEDFAREPETSRARLSPDGKLLAFVRNYAGKPQLHIAEIDSNKLSWLDLGEATVINNAPKEVGPYSWVGDRRLLITTIVWDTIYGVVAADWNGGLSVPISGYEDNQIAVNSRKLWAREVIHRFFDADQSVLMLDRHEDGGGAPNRPDVLRVDTKHGRISTVVKNPGEVGSWGVDDEGKVRVGILSHGDLSGVIYRDNEKEKWRTILPLENRKGQLRPVGFDAPNNRLLVAALTDRKRWTIFPLDPATGAMGDPLLSDPEYDILPESHIPSIDGHPLFAPIFSPRKDALLGVRFLTDAARVKWFDRELARHQAGLDRAAPDTVNLLVDMSHDGKRMLWFCYSDQNPGVYRLADSTTRSLKVLASRMRWIDPAKMAPMLAIKYKARDGLPIHGFLSVPVGHQPKNLPLIVMPHGGPWARDVWEFDPVVQLLANRGYAALQMNYRGSTGYGQELYENAKRQIGRQIQDDIEDGTRWAIAAGVADPKRIAIMGFSYGGYSTLFGLAHNPELYRCGISLAGVTDWLAFFTKSDVAEYKQATRHWREQLGDPKVDADFLKSISPVNFAEKITAPLLIVQGKEDRRVPLDQARRMIAALEKAGREPESLLLAGVAHNYGREKHRIETYTRIVAFLEKHLGPGVELGESPKAAK